jgi:hypothetical protein
MRSSEASDQPSVSRKKGRRKQMSTIPLHIVLQGLIALVPAQDGSNNTMTALLVEAHQHPDRACSAVHSPQLTVFTAGSQCLAANCTAAGRKCTCNLSHQEISIDIRPVPPSHRVTLNKLPESKLPFDQSSATDFAYVANMNLLGFQLDMRFRDDATPPPGLAARMRFPFDSLAACSLATRPDERVDNVHPLSFRPLGAEEKRNEVSQALAQMVVTTLTIPEDNGSGHAVTVTLRNFDGSNEHTLNLDLVPEGVVLVLSNIRTELFRDEPCEDGIGRDFAHFYDLAQNPPQTWEERLVPHVKYTQWKSAADLDAKECQIPVKNPMSLPICPMATFNSLSGGAQ